MISSRKIVHHDVYNELQKLISHFDGCISIGSVLELSILSDNTTNLILHFHVNCSFHSHSDIADDCNHDQDCNSENQGQNDFNALSLGWNEGHSVVTSGWHVDEVSTNKLEQVFSIEQIALGIKKIGIFT